MEGENEYLLRLFSVLSVHEILIFVRGAFRINRRLRNNRLSLVDAVIHRAPSNVLDRMRRFAETRLLSSTGEIPEFLRTRIRSEEELEESRTIRVEDGEHSFPTTVSRETKRRCYAAFFTATSDIALRRHVCVVCARECGVLEEEVVTVQLNRLPNKQRLVLSFPHPAQELVDDMLLQPQGLHGAEEGLMVDVCCTCLYQLRSETHVGPPRLSLANGLWIGNVPMELEVLTFPEQLLISLLYPR